MKNIIFLSDFSQHSDNALAYLSKFLKQQPDSNIYLIHTYALATKTGMFLSVKERMKEDARALLVNRKRRFEELIEDRHFVFYKAIEDTLIDVVEKLEKQLNAELIVTSMRGEGSDESNLIGPNAGSLITSTKVPLLLIPKNHKFKSIKLITFAIKSPKIKKKSTIKVLTSLFNSPKTKLKVLLAKGAQTDDMKLHLDNYTYTVKSSEHDSIYDAISTEQKLEKSDLIAVIRRNRGFFERFIKSGSFKKSLLNINVPLLVLRGAE